MHALRRERSCPTAQCIRAGQGAGGATSGGTRPASADCADRSLFPAPGSREFCRAGTRRAGAGRSLASRQRPGGLADVHARSRASFTRSADRRRARHLASDERSGAELVGDGPSHRGGCRGRAVQHRSHAGKPSRPNGPAPRLQRAAQRARQAAAVIGRCPASVSHRERADHRGGRGPPSRRRPCSGDFRFLGLSAAAKNQPRLRQVRCSDRRSSLSRRSVPCRIVYEHDSTVTSPCFRWDDAVAPSPGKLARDSAAWVRAPPPRRRSWAIRPAQTRLHVGNDCWKGYAKAAKTLDSPAKTLGFTL